MRRVLVPKEVMNRREFLVGAGALPRSIRLKADTHSCSSNRLGRTGVFPASVRADFPSVARETYLNSAALHPVGTFAANAMKGVIDNRLLGPGEGRADFNARAQEELKAKFGAMINAKATEIAYTANTTDGENIVVMGLFGPRPTLRLSRVGYTDRRLRSGSNVVIDELHFTTSLYMYKELEKKGVELRIVKHKNWKIDPEDMAKAIDKNTRLVSMALVSNVNGFMHDAKAVSAIAHARGALVFADIIQAVGAVPVDVKALGIDFASSGTYKWLMGERGIGFLYVREDLQGTVLPTTRYGHRQVSNFNRAQLSWEPMPGAARYETGGIPVVLAACVNAGIDYVNKCGLTNIRTHAKQLTDRLQNELPPLGYKALTPRDTETPIVAFEVKDAAATIEDAAGRQGGGNGDRQRESHSPRRVGVQHARRHRSRRRSARRQDDVTPLDQRCAPADIYR